MKKLHLGITGKGGQSKRLIDKIISDAEKASEKQERFARTPDMPADKLYKFDPLYSRRPVGICGNTFVGFPCCSKGVGKFCYCKAPCGNQYSLTAEDISGPYASPESAEMAQRENDAAIAHAREVMKHQRPEMETDIDEIVENLMQSMDEERRMRGW